MMLIASDDSCSFSLPTVTAIKPGDSIHLNRGRLCHGACSAALWRQSQILLSGANKKLEMYSRGREKSNGKVGQYRIETSVGRGCKQASSRVGSCRKWQSLVRWGVLGVQIGRAH